MPPFQSVVRSKRDAPTHPELVDRRVFISGLSDSCGASIAGGFARQRTRLVLHSLDCSGEAAQLADELKAQAAAVRLFAGEVRGDRAASERLARAGLGAFGGLDLIVNLIGPGAAPGGIDSAAEDVEVTVADLLRPAAVLANALAAHCQAARVGAAIMHVCLVRAGAGIEMARYALAKTVVETMVQEQAQRWFADDICVYGFAPGIAGDPGDVAPEADNVVPAHANFERALSAILLNAAGGRSRWLNGVTVAIPA